MNLSPSRCFGSEVRSVRYVGPYALTVFFCLALALLIPGMARAQRGVIVGPFQSGTGHWNLIPNGGFESGLSGWNQVGSYSASSSNSYVAVGSTSACITPLISYNFAGVALGKWPPVSLVPGQQYVLSGFIYTGEVSGGYAYLDIDDQPGDPNAGTEAANGVKRWQFVYATFTAPSNPVFVRCVRDNFFGGRAAAEANKPVYFDELAVTPAGEFVAPTPTAGTIYVRPNGSDSADGFSWARARRTLNSALTLAQPGDSLWVAAGTYNETITLGDRRKLYGGFNGAETALAQRNALLNRTVLSGNGSGNSVVVTLSGGSGQVLDSVTVQNGGLGVAVSGVSATIANCTITGNTHTEGNGAGIECHGCPSVALLNNVITNNSLLNSWGAAGVFAETWNAQNGAVLLQNNRIENNQAPQGDGAVGLHALAQVTLQGDTLRGNTSGSSGAMVIYNDPSWSSRTVTLMENVTIENNTGGGNAGFGTYTLRSATLRNCAIRSNTGSSQAAGNVLYGVLDSILLENTRFENNTGGWTAGLAVFGPTHPPLTVNGCTFSGNRALGTSYSVGGLSTDSTGITQILNSAFTLNEGSSVGGLSANHCPDLLINNCHITSNTTHANDQNGGVGGLGLYSTLNSGSTNITNNVITDNTGFYRGQIGAVVLNCSYPVTFAYNQVRRNTGDNGGGLIRYNGPILVHHNAFVSNTGTGIIEGWAYGALMTANGGEVSNNLFARNAGVGTGTLQAADAPHIVNNTFALNTASGAIQLWDGAAPHIANNILSDNTGGGIVVPGIAAAVRLLNNCVFNNGTNYVGLPAGPFDISVQPQFANPPSNNFRLLDNSACIDGGLAGTDGDSEGNTDLNDLPRVANLTTDMGAYENQFAPQARDLTDVRLRVKRSPLTFDRSIGRYTSDITLQNISNVMIEAPLHAVITGLPNNVLVANYTGYTPSGHMPYITSGLYSNTSRKLMPGQSTSIRVEFFVSGNARFSWNAQGWAGRF